MAKTNEEWELSKENIQPLQSGRKPGVLKVALNMHPDDAILQQRQAFEQELRTYSGEDPLSVWCNYIKWVEQNFPKGGRDGHIGQLMQRCLSILKDEKKYYDDNRFIEIWLKYAGVTINPIEVYEFVYSRNIGCKSAVLFITWSWELEQQGNLKRANQILREGLQRQAEPLEKLKSHYSEFEMRVANKVMTNPEDDNQEENCRSAFSVLKPGKKKNSAPVIRTGENVVDPGQSLTVGRQQQAIPRVSNPSAKIPFKIYNAENVAPSIPVQSENVAPFVLHSDRSKENERKPSKWNKVRAKPTIACPSVESANPEFKLHCDEAPQPTNTPRSVPKVCDVLRVRKGCASPPMALFERPDPLKKAMYDKNKVYGGAEEFSLEEIKAAAWWKNQKELEKESKLAEQQRLLKEQQDYIENLKHQIELLKKEKLHAPKPNMLLEEKCVENPFVKKPRLDSSNSSPSDHTKNSYSLENGTVRKELFPPSKLMTSYNEAQYIVQDLYNGTFMNPVNEKLNNEYMFGKDINHILNPSSQDKSEFPFFGVPKDLNSENLHAHQSEIEYSLTNNHQKEALPFAFYLDPTENISRSNHLMGNSFSSKQPTTDSCITDQENVLPDEDAENIPPKGYVQEKSKRELSGILEPSKNIMFVPLEHQEDEDDDEEEELISKEESIYVGNRCLQDDTIIPPCNTEQFVSADFLASTPRTHLRNARPQNDCLQDESYYTSDPHNTSVESCSAAPVTTAAETVTNNEPISTSGFRTVTRDHSIYPTSLSVIMESSREGYKSSSSSGSSAGATQLSQFYSHEKSNTYRQISKMDTFKEPLPPADILTPYITREPIPISVQDKEMFSIDCKTVDPFDVHQNEKLLQLPFASSILNEMIATSCKSLKDLKAGNKVVIGDNTYVIVNLIVGNSFGKVYEAVDYNSETNAPTSRVALKVCKHNSEWEFYICTTVHERLQELSSFPDVSLCVMKAIAAERFSDGFALVHDFCPLGTLFDLVNLYNKRNVPELISMYLTLEMLHIVSKLHECKIIHGDISPDNILLQDSILKFDSTNSYPNKTTVLKLIDFSRAIDLKCYKNGICFQTPQYDDCIEMREGKPWVFQVDWYGLLNCVHLLLFSEHMKVKKNLKGEWGIEKKFPRFSEQSIWIPLFDDLLNISSCYEQPDISRHIKAIELLLMKRIPQLKIELTHLAQLFPKNN